VRSTYRQGVSSRSGSSTATHLRPRGDDAIAGIANELLARFVRWLDAFGDQSQDPYDLWATSFGRRARSLYYRHRTIGALAAAPVVALDTIAPGAGSRLRPRTRSAIADAHYALGFLALGGPQVERARAYLDALEHERSKQFTEPAWGYPFDWVNRAGAFAAGTPFITSIPYCYEAFEAGYETFGDARYLETAKGVARFAADSIPVIEVSAQQDASAYSPFDRRQVTNASAYRGFLLATAGERFDRPEWSAGGSRNIALVLASQRPDGSWPYSLDGEDFVDNFHTCLVLKNLAKVYALTGDENVLEAVRAGYAFYVAHLLDDNGLPIPFARRPRLTLHRRDLYDYAEGLVLGSLLHDLVPEARSVVASLLGDLAARWQLRDGHFVTRELVVGRATVPYHRWAQSQTFHALAQLAAGPG
jgi:hypothetical protein